MVSNRNNSVATDALKAVKLDPAVLEAQITMGREQDAIKPSAAPAAFDVEPQIVKKASENSSGGYAMFLS